MDARDILGVGIVTSRAELRETHARLLALVDPRNGGSSELQRLVTAAYDTLTKRRSEPLPSVEPHRLFGLAPGTPADHVKVAYRRLAARVHPDAGGTDELFRIVGAAYDAIVRPSVSARAGRPSWAPSQSWVPREPWPKPRPERPYRPPPADARFHSPGWQDWLTVASYAGAIVLWFAIGALIAIGIASLRGVATFYLALAVPVWVVVLSMQARPVLGGLLRALARSRASYGRRRGADPEAFLADCCLDSPVNREREDLLYAAYSGWCRARRARPLSRWVFIEKLRTLGLLHVQASTMEYGLFVGIRLRPTA